MNQPREYSSASIEVTLLHGDVTARLHGYFTWRHPEKGKIYDADNWDLSTHSVLDEYRLRCNTARRHHPEMSPEQAEKVALLAWVKDMEAVGE